MPGINETLSQLLQNAILFLPRLVAGLVIFLVGLYLAGLARKAARAYSQRRNLDHELAVLFGRLAYWAVVILATVLALEQVNFNVVAFVAGLGIVGFTVGFALQDIAKNLVAGMLLLLQQPFNIGELIEVKGYSGRVEDISLRATELRTFDGLLVYIPNADVYTSPLTNLSRVPKRRLELQVGVAYGTDLDAATEIALAAVADVPGVVLDDPRPQVVFKTFGDSAIVLSLYYWFDTAATGYFDVQDRGVKAIAQAFRTAGIEIPFPIRTVVISSTQRLTLHHACAIVLPLQRQRGVTPQPYLHTFFKEEADVSSQPFPYLGGYRAHCRHCATVSLRRYAPEGY